MKMVKSSEIRSQYLKGRKEEQIVIKRILRNLKTF
jgi:hypothetical protein